MLLYDKFAYITNSVNKNWLSDMSSNQMKCLSFPDYLKNLFFRNVLSILSIIPFYGVSYKKKKETVINNNIFSEGVIIIGKKEKRFLFRFLDFFERDYRVICWMWDSISSGYTFVPQISKYKRVEFWSFDKIDCQRYGMKYNNQFYYDSITAIEDSSLLNGVFYLSNDRGRIKRISEIKEMLDGFGITNDIKVVRDNTSTDGYYNIYIDKGMPYSEVQKNVRSASAILEVICEGQTGPSLRAMESIFFKKKLITTNLDISQYDFYDPQNIFIIGVDNTNNLISFLNEPYQDLSPELINNYKISAWINRF